MANDIARDFPQNLLDEELTHVDDPVLLPQLPDDAIGYTMFDTPQSTDNTVTVLLPPERIGLAPSQSLVRIKSRPRQEGGDGRCYLGAVIEGPFAEPNGLKATSHLIVTTTVKGAMFMPSYHGRVQVQILGEEVDRMLVPPRFRPLPNSPVFALGEEETIQQLNLAGDVTLGLAVGYDEMEVQLPTDKKDVFPRHVGVLGTTGGGKSTTVSGLISKLAQNDVAVIVFDTEGEYTHIMHPTQDERMQALLERRGLAPQGVDNVTVHHLIGRETTNSQQNNPFCLQFSNLSPYAVMEILELNDAQQGRYLKGYDIAKKVLIELKMYSDWNELMELDELEQGFPQLTLARMYDVVRICSDLVAKEDDFPYDLRGFLEKDKKRVIEIVKRHKSSLPSNVWSWRKVQGSLARLLRLKIFDSTNGATSPDYKQFTQPGLVSIIDLSDTDSPQINNLVIAEILRGVRLQQERNYQTAVSHNTNIQKVVIVIEEAHEFLSSNRIKQMPVLFEQVARIARRGRKRWLGLMFVTQLPQHLPDEVLGLINNYVLHKIADANVISRLKRSIGGVDNGLWGRLPGLAAGQAIVVAESMTRPLLVAIDPTPCQLRMTD